MREVERSRFVPATPRDLENSLDPTRIVDLEGSFSVESTAENEGSTLVTATGPGIAFELRFERTEGGYYYTQAGDAGPFESMETWLTVEPDDEGSLVSMRSLVSIGVPLPFADRVAAWKRGGELERALERLAAEG